MSDQRGEGNLDQSPSSEKISRKKWILLCGVTGIAAGLANGLFGAGGGTLAVPAMERLLGVEERKAHATAISIILPLTLLSSILYVQNHFVHWGYTLRAILGGMAGGYIGARLLCILPTSITRKVFGVCMIAAAVRMML